ncbi:MAG: phenylacetate--CoA ligase, partial [Bacteroidota bacterium]|nr:phenylacetate--CoA ligase [Bacteroidota bacterium]
MYWENELEILNRNDIEKLQVIRLKKTIQAAMNSPYYENLYKQMGLSADSVKSVADIHKLPFTTKQNLRDNFPYGFLGLPQKELIRLHSSSGTTGNPTVIFHNRHDIDSWANLMARSLFCAGVRDTD